MLYPQYFIDDLKNRADIVRIIAVLTLLLVWTVACIGQEKPKAIQTDEFGRVGCEYLYAKVDILGFVGNGKAACAEHPLNAVCIRKHGIDRQMLTTVHGVPEPYQSETSCETQYPATTPAEASTRSS